MEKKAAGAGDPAGIAWKSALGCCAALAGCLAGPVAQAQEAGRGPAEVLVAEARAEPPLRLQVQTSSLPRLDAHDTGFQAPRVDFSVTPLSASGSGLGAVLGLANPGNGPQALGIQPRTAVDFGLRWTQRLQSQRQIDITAWRRLNTPDDAYSLIQMQQPMYGARVEMKLASGGPRSGFALDKGFLGFQFQGGGRISVRRKDGRPMIYYRTTF